jgi:hypothetical protein
MQNIRKFTVNAELPMAMAPEGGTNGQNELVAQLEPGMAQFGFWGAEDLHKAGRSEEVLILPIGIQYEYMPADWDKIDRMLMDIEAECGLNKPPVKPEERYQRFFDLGTHMIDFVSDHYKRFYPSFTSDATVAQQENSLGERLQVLLDQILRAAEAHFAIKPKGTVVDRCRRLEQAGWEQIFRADFKDFQQLSVLERGFADQLARETATSHWHMRIAESLQPIPGNYVKEHPSASRYAETLLLIWRAMSRVKNETFGKTPYLGDRKLLLSIGEPISVTERYAEYQSSRASAKECVTKLTADLHAALSQLIEKSTLT